MHINIPKTGYLRIKVIPKSSENKIFDICNDSSGEETIKIRIKAAPEKGKANKELIKFLSEELHISKSAISIISGKTDRLKLVKIQNERSI